MEGISDISYAGRALHEACAQLGLQTDVKIVSVVNRWRWTLDYEQSPAHPDFAKQMIKLETLLQSTLKRPIDLRLEPMADRNLRKKRNILTSKSNESK
jgi:hypothetical protein